jgi:hypothetical protein
MSSMADSQDGWSEPPQGAVWPVVAVTLLLGIGLVSLFNAFTSGQSTPPPLVIPADMSQTPMLLVAPGAEAVLAQLEQPERLQVHPPDQPLPELAARYLAILPEGEALPRLPEGYVSEGPRTVGGWDLYWVVAPNQSDESPRYDLRNHIRDAEVYFRDTAGNRTPCDRWRFGRWTCGIAPWLWVGPTEQLIRGQPRECIWAHPWVDHELVVAFRNVPTGNRLSGRYALADGAADIPDGAPVTFSVRTLGQAHDFVAANERGLRSYQVNLRDAQGAETFDVEFAVNATADGVRHFCFTAVVLGLDVVDQQSDEEQDGTGEGTGEGSGDSADGDDDDDDDDDRRARRHRDGSGQGRRRSRLPPLDPVIPNGDDAPSLRMGP